MLRTRRQLHHGREKSMVSGVQWTSLASVYPCIKCGHLYCPSLLHSSKGQLWNKDLDADIWEMIPANMWEGRGLKQEGISAECGQAGFFEGIWSMVPLEIPREYPEEPQNHGKEAGGFIYNCIPHRLRTVPWALSPQQFHLKMARRYPQTWQPRMTCQYVGSNWHVLKLSTD